jgi:hypothetical protein
MKQIAAAYYLSKQGNCAQSVAFALQKKRNAPKSALEEMSLCGAGRAPERMCGALYAAIHYAQNPEKVQEMKVRFAEASGGHLSCPQIRVARKLSCVQCVELASEMLDT